MDKSTPTARAIKKALEVFAENESEFDFVGWELAYILNGLTKTRWERILKAYTKEQR